MEKNSWLTNIFSQVSEDYAQNRFLRRQEKRRKERLERSIQSTPTKSCSSGLTKESDKTMKNKLQKWASTMPAVPSIYSQLKALGSKESLMAFFAVAPIAAFVPVAIFAFTWSLYEGASGVSHDAHSLSHAWDLNKPLCVMILFGCLFSAKSVYTWGLSAFSNRVKAVGFCILIEGSLMVSPYVWVKITAAVILILINMFAAGALQAIQAQVESKMGTVAPVVKKSGNQRNQARERITELMNLLAGGKEPTVDQWQSKHQITRTTATRDFRTARNRLQQAA